MTTWAGRALIAAGTAGMVYGVYLMAGKAWAILLGSFVVYVAGYTLTTRKGVGADQARHEEAKIRVSTSAAREAAQRRGMN